MTNQPKLFFHRERLDRFKAAYARAVKNGDETFSFDGHEFYVPYAKYLIQFLNAQFGIPSMEFAPLSKRIKQKRHNLSLSHLSPIQNG